jgi:hypothetical protein
VLEIQSFRGTDCDTYLCLMAEKVRAQVLVSKWATNTSDVEKFVSIV